jgi:hypothetical protein
VRLETAALLALVPLACGGEPSRTPRVRSSLVPPEGRSGVAAGIRAGWNYHPGDTGLLVARSVLQSGTTVLAGQRGERWLVDAQKGIADVAADLAPEELVAIVPPRASRGGAEPARLDWLFVGKSGTTYEAREPLSAFVRSSAPLEPLTRVREGGGVLMGLRRDGALARSDTAGASWVKVGPDDARFEDVALRGDGQGLALAIPEALYETRDYGATWKRSAVSPTGVVALAQDDKEGVVAETALGPFQWQSDAKAPLVALGRTVSPRAYSLGVPLPVGPSGDALILGRAVVVGSTWIEARPSGALSWHLVSGAFGERLHLEPLAVAKGCETVFLGGFGSELYLACARQKGEEKSQPIEFQHSTDRGRSWAAEPYYVVGRTGEFSMAVGAGGTLVMTGICPAAAREAGCMPAGVHRRQRTSRDSGPDVQVVQAATPSLIRTAYALSFSLDGRSLYAVGRRFKSDSLAVFVSRDGGSTFEARDIEPLKLSQDEDEARPRFRVDSPIRSAASGADGTVSLVVNLSGSQSWLVVDDDGRAISLVKAPVANARVGAAGALALAVDPVTRDVYESLDAGANFRPIGKLPVDPCPGAQLCDARIACTVLGCVFGNVISRVGWRAEGATGFVLDPKERSTRKRENRFGTPLTCTLGSGEWQRIPFAAALPTARDAAIGKVAWVAVAADPRSASGTAFHMKSGPASKLEVVPLLEPSKAPAKDAFAVALRPGGAVAVRYVVPNSATGPEIKHVEVAWDDVTVGRTGRALVENGGAARPSDFGDGKGNASPANVALLELASGGVYVRLHAASGDDQPTLFVTNRALESIPAVPWPDEARQRGRSTMARLGDLNVPLRLDAVAAVRARLGDRGTWAFDALTLGWNRPAEFGLAQRLESTRFGDRFGVVVTTFDTDAGWASSSLYAFRGDGPLFEEPLRVATQLDLPAMPRACGAADRSATPRVVAPFQPGTRHPVLVADPFEPMRVLLTGDAVLHGSPSSPCLAAYEAVLAPETAGTPGERALLFADALDRSWLFRVVETGREQPRSLEYRTMNCRFDPSVEIPPEVKGQNGTFVGAR